MSPLSASWPRRLAARPEYDTRLGRELEAVVDGLVSSSPRPLVSVFVAGSLAAGDAVVIPCSAGEILCLSDLDLGLVLRDPSDRTPVRAAVQAWLEGEAAARARAFFSGLDVGLYTATDLAAQPLKPGTFEMTAAAFVLRGDPSLLGALPRFEPSAMPPIEGRRLLANRVAELIRAALSRPARERAAARPFDATYAAGKLLLDAGTALLAATGAYRVGLDARGSALHDSPAVRAAFGGAAAAYLDAARFWTSVRRGRVAWDEVEARYAPGAGAVPPALWDEARDAAAAAWRWLERERPAGHTPSAGRERVRRWRAWAQGRPACDRLEALARAPRFAPHDAADEAIVLLFVPWTAAGSTEMAPALEKRLRALLPSAVRPPAAAGRVEWAHTLLAARAGLMRAGDQ